MDQTSVTRETEDVIDATITISPDKGMYRWVRQRHLCHNTRKLYNSDEKMSWRTKLGNEVRISTWIIFSTFDIEESTA